MEWILSDFSLPLGQKTYIMGILNITPDSFSDGGLWNNPEAAVRHAAEMEADGADIIDIGAQSTRPGHIPVTPKEEWARLKPILETLKGNIQIPVSIDTYYHEVAKRALDMGAAAINDVSGVWNARMAETVAAYKAGWVVMHTGGGNADCTVNPDINIIDSVNQFFEDCLERCGNYGIHPAQLCLDMGIGFGKTYEQNLTLIRDHKQLRHPHNALLTGLSRKRVIGQATCIENPAERLPGNIAAHTCAILGGTDILRVHSVKEEKAAAKMADILFRGNNETVCDGR